MYTRETWQWPQRLLWHSKGRTVSALKTGAGINAFHDQRQRACIRVLSGKVQPRCWSGTSEKATAMLFADVPGSS